MSVVHANDSIDVNGGVNEQQEDIVEANGIGGELVLAPKKNSTAMIRSFFVIETGLLNGQIIILLV
jgi:hypothetical protein